MIRRLATIHNLTFFFCTSFLLGLFCIRNFALVSNLALFGLFFLAVYYLFQSKGKLKSTALLPWVFFLIPIVLHLLHYFKLDSGNEQYYLDSLYLKASFFILPFSFLILPNLKPKLFLSLLYCFLIVCVLFSIGILIYYLSHYCEINDMYSHSKIIPTPINHIRFSLMVVTAISIGFHLLQVNFQWKYAIEKKFIIGMIIFLIIFLHIYSVRSGLISFYVLVFIFGSIYLFKQKRIKLLLGLILALILLPLVSYFSIPTFHNKMKNTIFDIQSFKNNESANQYSLAGRMISYQVSCSLWEESPLFGVGVGNLRQAVQSRYQRDFPKINKEMVKLPHNEFLRYATSYGVFGLLLFIISFYFPLFYQKNYKNSFLLIQYSLVTLSFFVESTLNTVHGLYFTLGFILIPLFSYKNNLN